MSVIKIIILGDKKDYLNKAFIRAFGDFRNLTKSTNADFIIEEYTKSTISLFKQSVVDECIFIINEKLNNEYIPLDEDNYYILINYDETHFDTDIELNKLIVEEYDSSVDYSTYDKLADYIYQKDESIVIPWGSHLSTEGMLDIVKGYTEGDDKYNIIMTRKYNNIMMNRLTIDNITKKRLLTLKQELELIKNYKLSLCLTDDITKIDLKAILHASYGITVITNSPATYEFLSPNCIYVPEYNDEFMSSVDRYNKTDEIIESYNSIKKHHVFEVMEKIINEHTIFQRVKLFLTYFRVYEE